MLQKMGIYKIYCIVYRNLYAATLSHKASHI